MNISSLYSTCWRYPTRIQFYDLLNFSYIFVTRTINILFRSAWLGESRCAECKCWIIFFFGKDKEWKSTDWRDNFMVGDEFIVWCLWADFFVLWTCTILIRSILLPQPERISNRYHLEQVGNSHMRSWSSVPREINLWNIRFYDISFWNENYGKNAPFLLLIRLRWLMCSAAVCTGLNFKMIIISNDVKYPNHFHYCIFMDRINNARTKGW